MTTTPVSPAQFRIALAHRLRRAIFATVTISVAAGGAACSGDVIRATGEGEGGGPAASHESSGARTNVDGQGGRGGQGGAPADDVNTSAQAGIQWMEDGTVCVPRGSLGNGGSGGAGASHDGSGASYGGSAGAFDSGGDEGLPEDTCPPFSALGIDYPVSPNGCWYHAFKDGAVREDQCCYEFVASCGVSGRPFLVGERARTARAQRREGGAWGAAARPDVAQLSQETRAALADAWLRDALLEHASIASFSRFSLEMMAVGAPAELLDAAHDAARDEVRHAALCFGLASAYAGAALAPAPFAFGGGVEVSSDIAEIAARAVREGCVGETIAAVQASEQLALATDAAVRGALAIIAEDEARHAELAWRFVAWALKVGGGAVREAVSAAFEASFAAPPPDAPATDAPKDALAAHGRADSVVLAASHRRALRDIITPAMRALLSA